jgi:formate hydrogenlyase subunit 3/multisubunit Na+/H+ antiporter MnhD subunit
MNLVEAALGVAAVVAAISVVGALVVPRAVRPAMVGAGTALGGVAGVVAGAAALSGQGLSVVLPGLLPLAGVLLTVDALSGMFVAIVGAVAVAVGIYGIGYARNGLGGRGVQAMVLIGFLLMDNGITAVGFLTTAGVGPVVELGVSLDVLLAVLVLGVLTGRMREAFGNTDLDELRELHD